MGELGEGVADQLRPGPSEQRGVRGADLDDEPVVEAEDRRRDVRGLEE